MPIDCLYNRCKGSGNKQFRMTTAHEMSAIMSLSLVMFLISANAAHADLSRDEQIHLSLGADPTQMAVTWVTQEKPLGDIAVVMFHEPGRKEQYQNGTVDEFHAGKGHTMYIHRVLMTGLRPGATYLYAPIDSGRETRKKYSFRTLSSDSSAHLLLYGDMGTEDAISVPNLIGEAEAADADAIFHVGDMAYNLGDDEGRNGDKFMRMIEPIAGTIPYQVLPGNHESNNNFSHYDHLFTMMDATSGNRSNFYYSTNIGALHVISLTTEFYFYTKYGTDQIQSQYNWLVEDLKQANEKHNRKARPWIVVMTHRPMYCTAEKSHCYKDVETVREGIDGKFGLEKLLHKYKVDLYIAGHAHIYERSYPLFKSKVMSTSADPYHNPAAMIHVTTGSAGCNEGLYKFQPKRPEWSAKRLRDYGYTRLFGQMNRLRLQQITDKDGRVIDEFSITKDDGHVY